MSNMWDGYFDDSTSSLSFEPDRMVKKGKPYSIEEVEALAKKHGGGFHSEAWPSNVHLKKFEIGKSQNRYHTFQETSDGWVFYFRSPD